VFLNGQNNRLCGPESLSEMTAMICVHIHCVGLHCQAEISHLVADNLFGSQKQHWGGHLFHSKGECKWLLVNHCECKSPVSTVMEYLNLCQYGMCASVYSETILKNNDISL